MLSSVICNHLQKTAVDVSEPKSCSSGNIVIAEEKKSDPISKIIQATLEAAVLKNAVAATSKAAINVDTCETTQTAIVTSPSYVSAEVSCVEQSTSEVM